MFVEKAKNRVIFIASKTLHSRRLSVRGGKIIKGQWSFLDIISTMNQRKK